METNNIELTPEQKGMLASLAQETGEPVDALIDKALEDLQERLHTKRTSGIKEGDRHKETPKPIWEKIRDGFAQVPEEEMQELPTDGAAQVDHYAYGLPKR
jgi:predicted transcriptional regulator